MQEQKGEKQCLAPAKSSSLGSQEISLQMNTNKGRSSLKLLFYVYGCWHVCVSIHYEGSLCPQGLEGTGSPRTRVTEGYEYPRGH